MRQIVIYDASSKLNNPDSFILERVAIPFFTTIGLEL